jgi:translation initiation factor 1A
MPPKKSKKSKNTKSKGLEKGKDTFTLAENMEEYAKVIKCVGERKLKVVLTDNSQVLALIPGRFCGKKKVWMKAGDVILVSRRDFQDDKLDVINKYEHNDIRKLHKMGLIPDFFLDCDAVQDVQDGGIQFCEDEQDDEDSQEKDDVVVESEEGSESSIESDVNIDDL